MKKINRETIFSNFIKLIIIILYITGFTQLFGAQEALTSVAGITAILIFYYLPLELSVARGTILTSVSFLILGLLASLNLFLPMIVTLPINLISIFMLMIVYGKPFIYKFYIPYVLVYIFASTTDPLDFNLLTRFISLSLSAGIIGLVYYFRHKKSSTNTNFLDIKKTPTDILYVASTMSIGISLTIFISQLLDIEKSMWICMTIMSLTQIETDQFKSRFKQRMIGSIIGIVLYSVLFSLLIPSSLHLPLTLVLAFVYNFIEDYFLQIIFITMNALYASQTIWQLDQAALVRIIFILIGATIVYVLNKLVMNSYFKKIIHRRLFKAE